MAKGKPSGKLCECGCGEYTTVYPNGNVSRFRRGHGTRLRSGADASGYKHGQSCTPTWYSWANMINRCTRPSNPAWERYGGRGITVCERWLGKEGFQNFLADMGERPDGLTLDRVDNSKGYSPENCRWTTRKEQALNTRNVTLTDADVAWVRAHPEKSRKDLAQILGVSDVTISNIRNRKHRFADPA